MKYINPVLSILIWAACVLLTVFLFVVQVILSLILFPFPFRKAVLHRQCFWWADILIGINPFWRLKVSGREKIRKDQTYIVVANHQSLADIVMLYQTHMLFKWVAKESLFRIPVFGWCMSLCGYIRLERGNIMSIRETYRQARACLRQGTSVLFFPEGTRSKSSQMNPFQNGAFKLAVQEKVSVLPVCIKGSTHAIPKGSWVFKGKAVCEMTILDPVPVPELGQGGWVELKEEVRHRMQEYLPED